ncbi:MAG TPA: class E sortase [Candidatus Saccharimonadales bacterium]|jgi:LPXTG-site transpeptidase (sortase) family protein
MSLSKLNTTLLLLIIAVNLYVVAMPLMPIIGYQLDTYSGRWQDLERQLRVTGATTAGSDSAAAVSKPDSLTIPAMMLDQPVLEGRDTYDVLNRGILRWPASSTPDKGGNTVLLGHRFTYSQPRGVFYNLDKLKTGDMIGVSWKNKQYIYRVTGSRVVKPAETQILAPTAGAQLTLFTCTPLLWPKDRLVVTATLEKR